VIIIIPEIYYFPPAGMQSIAISVSVCLSLCISEYVACIFQIYKSKLLLHVASAWSFLRQCSGICYVFLVLWITSCFHIMGQMQIQAWSLWHSELFTVTRQVAPLNYAPRAKCTITNCLVNAYVKLLAFYLVVKVQMSCTYYYLPHSYSI